MPLLLRPATPPDTPHLTSIYFSAFTSDSISRLVFPSRDPGTPSWDWWEQSIVTEMQDPSAHFLCVYDSSSGTVVAYAKWNYVTEGSAEWKGDEVELPTWPLGADVKVANHFFGTLGRRRVGIMGCDGDSGSEIPTNEPKQKTGRKWRKHYYLELIATHPDWQGKGAAGKLIRWGLERADKEGVECYLEASPRGKEIYEYFGFEEKGRLVVPVEGKEDFVECFMVRAARGGGSGGD
ncbi:putative N-acetyltransferase protein [Rutstroemia sp. NJR-2017a BVV2]|nr:putative N-acetyltransferase protein [Rutstroemia sp. NJR-2017a BVV2]